MADTSTLDRGRTRQPQRDLALVSAALQDRQPARHRLGERLRCVPRMLRAQNNRLGQPLDEHELADLGQDSIIIVLRKLREFAGRAPLEAWIHAICRRQIHNAIRGQRRRPTTGIAGLEDSVVSHGRDFANRELVSLALDQLDPREASVIRSRHFDGMTYAEIARTTDVSRSTLKARYRRGLSRLELRLRDASPLR